MADTFTQKERSNLMSRIGSKDTKPEMKIRKGLHAMGFRYSLHDKNLPGKPDMKLPKYNALIEINGCFWHGHGCTSFHLPKSREEYWHNKIKKNQKRDKENVKKLLNLGWRVLIIWGCSMRGKYSYDLIDVLEKTEKWLISDKKFAEISENCSN